MATSTVFAVKDALFDLLRTWPGLDGVQIEWARPSEDAMELESVWFEGTTPNKQKAEALGNTRRDEVYDLQMIVSVRRDGDEARLCEQRSSEIVAAIEDLVRQHPKPIPAPLFDVQFAGAVQQPHQAPGQRFSDVLVTLAARARI